MSRRLSRWLRRMLFIGIPLVFLLYLGSRTVAPELPPGVRKEILHPVLAGRNVTVTMYYPADRTEAPLAVVAHGFTRSKRYMAGWGVALAREGFIAAVPTQPALVDPQVNSQALAELVSQLRNGSIPLKVKPGAKAALMGFSMGGLTTMLAAGKQPVDAWVGLDPVGMNDSWLEVGKTLKAPCAVLRAEPGTWNKQGNARDLFAVLPGPKFTLKVRNATHLDVESPTDFVGQLLAGRVDPKRHATFESYSIAFLKAELLHDADAKRFISEAGNDPRLAEVEVDLTK